MKNGCFFLLLISLLGGCAGLPGGGGASESTETAASSGQSSRAAPNDRAITAAIQSAMQQDELLTGTSVNVVSEQGIVTLSGQLSSARAANRAFSVARNTEGVRRVISNLTWPSP
ncbi:MAG: BON domain-containing protein [Candidatus Competibacteraceae bacterium]|nr:BON domain-containing protein [Candidatus Competibacteraceae bacterium]